MTSLFRSRSSKRKGKERATDNSSFEHNTPPLPDPDESHRLPDLNTLIVNPPPGDSDGAGDDDVHNSSYAARCREVMHLYSDLKVLMYVVAYLFLTTGALPFFFFAGLGWTSRSNFPVL